MAFIHLRLKHDNEEQIIAWLREEANSEDGLTWQELQDAIKHEAEKHGYTLTQEDWDAIKGLFDYVDTDGSGSVSPDELETALE